MSENGFQVDAVDLSGVAIELIRSRNKPINCFHQDPDLFTPQPDSYELIVNINFLNRRLFPHMKKGLRISGILVFNSFLDICCRSDPHPGLNRDYYLGPNELLNSFLSLRILFYREDEVMRASGRKREIVTMVARKTVEFG